MAPSNSHPRPRVIVLDDDDNSVDVSRELAAPQQLTHENTTQPTQPWRNQKKQTQRNKIDLRANAAPMKPAVAAGVRSSGKGKEVAAMSDAPRGEKTTFSLLNPAELKELSDLHPAFLRSINKKTKSGFLEIFFEFSNNMLSVLLSELIMNFNPSVMKACDSGEDGAPPPWWPTTKAKWWIELGFPTDYGEPPFKHPSALIKLWKLALLASIIDYHSSKSVCWIIQQSQSLLKHMSIKEKMILSVALDLLDCPNARPHSKVKAEEHSGHGISTRISLLLRAAKEEGDQLPVDASPRPAMNQVSAGSKKNVLMTVTGMNGRSGIVLALPACSEKISRQSLPQRENAASNVDLGGMWTNEGPSSFFQTAAEAGWGTGGRQSPAVSAQYAGMQLNMAQTDHQIPQFNASMSSAQSLYSQFNGHQANPCLVGGTSCPTSDGHYQAIGAAGRNQEIESTNMNLGFIQQSPRPSGHAVSLNEGNIGFLPNMPSGTNQTGNIGIDNAVHPTDYTHVSPTAASLGPVYGYNPFAQIIGNRGLTTAVNGHNVAFGGNWEASQGTMTASGAAGQWNNQGHPPFSLLNNLFAQNAYVIPGFDPDPQEMQALDLSGGNTVCNMNWGSLRAMMMHPAGPQTNQVQLAMSSGDVPVYQYNEVAATVSAQDIQPVQADLTSQDTVQQGGVMQPELSLPPLDAEFSDFSEFEDYFTVNDMGNTRFLQAQGEGQCPSSSRPGVILEQDGWQQNMHVGEFGGYEMDCWADYFPDIDFESINNSLAWVDNL